MSIIDLETSTTSSIDFLTILSHAIKTNEEKVEKKVEKTAEKNIIDIFNEILEKCIPIEDILLSDKYKDDTLDELNEVLREISKSFDSVLEEVENKNIESRKIFLKSMRIQGLISRTAHRIQKRRYFLYKKRISEEMDHLEKIKLKYEEEGLDLKKVLDELNLNFDSSKKEFDSSKKEFDSSKKELSSEIKGMKESVITISSLVFTAFTFIQLNFVAFQNSKDYLIIDRLILFSGINLFLIIGIYVIFSMIKSIVYKEDQISKILKGRLAIPTSIMAAIFGITLFMKNKIESKPKYIEEKQYVEYLLTVKNEKLEEIEEGITKLKGESLLLSKEIEQKRKKLEDLNYIMGKAKSEVKKTIDNEILGYEDRISKLEKKIVMLETEKINLKSIELAKKEENIKEKIENKKEKSS